MVKQDDLFNRLIGTSEEAFHGQHYEAAYHALAAALHLAQDEKNADRLEEISQIAREQHAYIDKYAPGNVMSSMAAGERRGVDMYKMLGDIANARARMIRDTKHLSDLSLSAE